MAKRTRRTPSTAREYPRTARLNQLFQEILAEELERHDDDRPDLDRKSTRPNPSHKSALRMTPPPYIHTNQPSLPLHVGLPVVRVRHRPQRRPGPEAGRHHRDVRGARDPAHLDKGG